MGRQAGGWLVTGVTHGPHDARALAPTISNYIRRWADADSKYIVASTLTRECSAHSSARWINTRNVTKCLLKTRERSTFEWQRKSLDSREDIGDVNPEGSGVPWLSKAIP